MLHDFLEPMGITQYRLAKEIGVAQRRIGEMVAGRRSIAADTALRMAAFFGTDHVLVQSYRGNEVPSRPEVLAREILLARSKLPRNLDRAFPLEVA